jgi:hypothetical protein
MKPDAYDILNSALTMWGQHAMANNDATSIKKNSQGMPVHVETADGIFEITGVRYDRELGIVFTSNE